MMLTLITILIIALLAIVALGVVLTVFAALLPLTGIIIDLAIAILLVVGFIKLMIKLFGHK